MNSASERKSIGDSCLVDVDCEAWGRSAFGNCSEKRLYSSDVVCPGTECKCAPQSQEKKRCDEAFGSRGRHNWENAVCEIRGAKGGVGEWRA